MDEKKSNFDSLFSFIKNIGVKDEFREDEGEKKPPESSPALKNNPVVSSQGTIKKPTEKENITSSSSSNQPTSGEIAEMHNKMIEYITKINEDGIDFFEIFEAAQAMGGITPANLKQAFVILKIASGNTLTVESVLKSARRYKQELSDLVEENISSKTRDRELLVSNQNNEKLSLNNDVVRLSEEITKLTEELSQKRSSLQLIETKYTPDINSIDRKISAAELGKKEVFLKMDQAIEGIKSIK